MVNYYIIVKLSQSPLVQIAQVLTIVDNMNDLHAYNTKFLIKRHSQVIISVLCARE